MLHKKNGDIEEECFPLLSLWSFPAISDVSLKSRFVVYANVFRVIEKLANIDLGTLTEVTQSVTFQKQKLGQLLEEINKLLALPLHGSQSWNVELIHSKHLPAILYLLVHLARQYNCPYRIPNNVVINVITVQVRSGFLSVLLFLVESLY